VVALIFGIYARPKLIEWNGHVTGFEAFTRRRSLERSRHGPSIFASAMSGSAVLGRAILVGWLVAVRRVSARLDRFLHKRAVVDLAHARQLSQERDNIPDILVAVIRASCARRPGRKP
jgi:EAL domain-containing protein (putative c-di-GMP-specific phosphodiesterase class I)